MGYAPLFDTVLDGTLFGRWPHTGIWTCLLSQVDKHGNIDKHPNLLAAKIGVPVDVLLGCINDFMQPDPGSRTADHDGRRLELIEPGKRDWGWRVLNHSFYREKARKQFHQQAATESGKDAERKRTSRRVRSSPDETGEVRLSNTNTNTNTKREPPLPPLPGGMEGECSDSDELDSDEQDEPPFAETPRSGEPTPAAAIAIALREQGVMCTSSHPTLLGWVKDGKTPAQVLEAVAIARLSKPWPERLNPGYINAILRKPQRAPPAQPSARSRITWRPPKDETPGEQGDVRG